MANLISGHNVVASNSKLSHISAMFQRLCSLFFLLLAIQSFASPKNDPRVTELISKMTLEEKLSLLSGHDYETNAIPRLGIPALKMTDGAAGVVLQDRSATTSFPAPIAMSATWNSELVKNVASAIAEEARDQGHDMLLGPCINIQRTPFGGRNFESFGEDPYLTSELATNFVSGVQNRGIMTSTKHFALNNQEFDRLDVDVRVSERAMNEIYFPAFLASVKAGTSSIMAAYNSVNGHHATEEYKGQLY